MPETRGLCLSEEQTVSTVRNLVSIFHLFNRFLLRNFYFEISFTFELKFVFYLPLSLPDIEATKDGSRKSSLGYENRTL